MLLILTEYLAKFYSGFHVFQYLTLRGILAAVTALLMALLIGPRHDIGARADEWLRALTQFEVELYCDGKLMERGYGSNVLEGPLSALRYLMELLARDPDNPPLAAGEIISTGTLTRALPVKPGETWTTKLKGIDLEGASLRLP